MARTRSVKPDDFLDEVLGGADFPVEGQLLRLGLNCLADKEGWLEDRPKRIAAQLFPYRPGVDVDGLLDHLRAAGSIRRYAVGSERMIQLIGFLERQKPYAARPGWRALWWVYFVQVGDGGPIKIGITHDVAQRLAFLQTANPGDLRLLCSIRGGKEVERELHARFAAFRLRGEWFSPALELLQYVKTVTEGAP